MYSNELHEGVKKLIEASEDLRDFLVEFDYVGDDGAGDIPDDIWKTFCDAINFVDSLGKKDK